MASTNNIARKGNTSCERCKLRKSKCDKQYPSCERCLSARVTCAYTGRKRPGFPAGHRQLLEHKIDQLESELHLLKEADSIKKRGLTDGDDSISALESTSVLLSHSMDRGSPKIFHDPPLIATFERTRQITEVKPPTDLVLSLTSLFFRHVHPWFPFLDPQRVLAEMGSIDDPTIVYYALFGLSLKYSYDSRLDQQSSDSFWKYSKRRIFVEVLEEPSYMSLEALTILTLDLSGMTNGPQVWGALAVAIRLAAQLKSSEGHVFRTSTDDTGNESLTTTDQIYRRRLFWAIYALDCYISITTSHPSELAEYHIGHFMPSREMTWREPSVDVDSQNWSKSNSKTGSSVTHISVFCYQLALMDISRRLHIVYMEYVTEGNRNASYWMQKISNCIGELSGWMQNLPQNLHLECTKHPHAPMNRVLSSIVMLHAYYHALMIHINGLAIDIFDERLEHVISDFQKQSHACCMKSVDILIDIISRHIEKTKDMLGWPLAWSIFVAARYLLVAAWTNGADLHNNFNILLQGLKKMSRYWQISGKYWRLLSQASCEFKNSTINNGKQSIPGVFTSLIDLKISACDLEDQFRTDPVLHSTLYSREHIGTKYQNEGHIGAASIVQDLKDISDELYFNMHDQSSDCWFSVPLFTSSAYQYEQLPITESLIPENLDPLIVTNSFCNAN
ncbi:fungal-specific transcription factor domain-containing protein [Dipodascopsis uninucleata]